LVFYGSADPAKALAITSSSNTLKSVIAGATIDLHAASSTPVKVQISKDDGAVVDAMKSFVEGFNDLIDVFDKYDKYDAENEVRGLLLGDSTIGRLRTSLYSMVNTANRDLKGSYKSLTQIGIRVGSKAKLTFDSAKFSAALATDRDGVKDLFTFRKTERQSDGSLKLVKSGLGVNISDLLGRLTDSTTGVVERRMDNLDDVIELNKDRIKAIEVRLGQKEAKLRAEFLQMEKVLAGLQGQSDSLLGLANLASQSRSNSK